MISLLAKCLTFYIHSNTKHYLKENIIFQVNRKDSLENPKTLKKKEFAAFISDFQTQSTASNLWCETRKKNWYNSFFYRNTAVLQCKRVL